MAKHDIDLARIMHDEGLSRAAVDKIYHVFHEVRLPALCRNNYTGG
jgi:hypothetical protein